MTEQLPAMPAEVEELNSRIACAVANGQLMESTAKNIGTLLSGAQTNLYFSSVNELADRCEWSELNDRFYQTLAFGTGGCAGAPLGKSLRLRSEERQGKASDQNSHASARM